MRKPADDNHTSFSLFSPVKVIHSTVTVSEGKPPKRLSEESVRTLLTHAQQGDRNAHNRLIRTHLGLVINIAKRFRRHDDFMELGDLIQQGCLGLLRAIAKFDPSKSRKGKKVTFVTYAVYWIKHFVRREIAVHGRTVAVPTHIQYYLQRAARDRKSTRLNSSH